MEAPVWHIPVRVWRRAAGRYDAGERMKRSCYAMPRRLYNSLSSVRAAVLWPYCEMWSSDWRQDQFVAAAVASEWRDCRNICHP
jgi:hypothetical protein